MEMWSRGSYFINDGARSKERGQRRGFGSVAAPIWSNGTVRKNGEFKIKGSIQSIGSPIPIIFLQKGFNMKRIVVAALLALMPVLPAASDDVPFANPPPQKEGEPIVSPLPSLSDIMVLMQLRYTLLWSAGKTKNWNLVRYEVMQDRDTLSKAAMRYVNIPAEQINNTWNTLTDIQNAADAENFQMFKSSYSDLTAACNSCHKAAGLSFMRIQTP